MAPAVRRMCSLKAVTRLPESRPAWATAPSIKRFESKMSAVHSTTTTSVDSTMLPIGKPMAVAGSSAGQPLSGGDLRRPPRTSERNRRGDFEATEFARRSVRCELSARGEKLLHQLLGRHRLRKEESLRLVGPHLDEHAEIFGRFHPLGTD